MYYAHFGLTRPPFRITPDTTLFFSGADRGSVLEALTYVVMTGEGITKVIGEVGSGKTMLCRMLEEKLPDNVETLYIANPNVDADNILNVIAFEAGFKEKTANKLEIMQWLQSWLLERFANARRVVVLIEEAQGMPVETLEEIRLLSNLETGQDKLLQIVLFGQPELDVKLGRPEIRQLQDRIAHNFYLSPLTRDQIREYANFRMRQAGYHGPDMFDDKVCRTLASCSRGLIRRVNILADKTLLAAFSASTTKLSPQHARIAARDSHFTDTRQAIDPLWWFVAGGVAAGFILAILLAWAIWPHTNPSSALAAERTHNRSAGVSAVQPGMTANRQSEALPAPGGSEDAGDNPPDPDSKTETALESDYTTAPSLGVVEGRDAGKQQSANGEQISDEISRLEQDAVAVLAQSLLENRITITRKWLAEAAPNTYSIQLMMLKTDSAASLNHYLKGLPSTIDINDIFIYEAEISGDPMLGVLYQQFNSRDAALARMNDMPAAFRKIKPFLLRSVRGLRNEIAKSNG
ncbi:MAG: AAA family ATPase [Gammaproteobacteria bacterium]|nr:AAA family ATPase [Gammaproteobacteria bacterium]